MIKRTCTFLWQRVGLLVAVALVASAASAVTATATGNFAAATDSLLACAVPDAGVLYQTTTGTCEEDTHTLFELPVAATVDSLSSTVGSLTATVGALSSTVDSLAAIAATEGELVTNSATVSGGGTDWVAFSVFAACPQGKWPVGGGFEGFEDLSNDRAVTLDGSRPEIIDNVPGWIVEGQVLDGTRTVSANALCADMDGGLILP